MKNRMIFRSAIYLAICTLTSAIASGSEATGNKAMVATVHPLATDAGIAALQSGGNAVDAAIAAGLTLGVVDGHNSGLGGGCFILIRLASGKIFAIDGRETAPLAATRDLYLRNGKADSSLSTTGPLAVAVPGALAAYEVAIRNHGNLALAPLLRTAATQAAAGFQVDRIYAGKLRSAQAALSKFPGSRALLLKPDGSPYQEGEILRLPELARTYRNIAEHGIEWFYHGPFAAQVAAWIKVTGGILTRKDFASYRPKFREPVVSNYRGYQIVGFPPPSSGGIHVAQILNILENFDMHKIMQDDPAQAQHLVAEAMKLAFADRAHWLGDADFVKVPRGLTDKTYARQLAAKIDSKRATDVRQFGNPPAAETNVYGKHTTHIATADAEGNWVAMTQTVNTTFGSKVVVPGTGLVLNNEMDDFAAQPGVPNAFGLLGAEANAIAPGKRPLSSMSPTIVLKDGQPVLTVGGAGGPKIITATLLTILRFVDGGQKVSEALAAPRFHHQWRPARLFVEKTLDPGAREVLRQRGHEIEVLSSAGVCQAIARDETGTFFGVSDPRVPGKAAGLSYPSTLPAFSETLSK